jgi:hypothetical protein
VLERAQARSTSLRAPNTRVGTRDRTMTVINTSDLDREMEVDRRTRSGIGRAGVMIRMDGIVKSKVVAFNDAVTWCSRDLSSS